MRSLHYFKTISRILIFAMLHLCWLTSYGYAEMVPTEPAVQVQDDRQRILDLLDREEVVDKLGKYGISKVEAVARINSLTDEEVVVIAGKLDELPEGGFNFGPSGCHRTTINGRVVSESSGCDSADAGVVLAILAGLVLLIALFFYWVRVMNKVDYPSSNEGSTSEPVVEEVCDPGFESCI